MNQADCLLETFGRIIVQVKLFKRHSLGLSGIATKAERDRYLKQHLSPEDWDVWQAFQSEANEVRQKA